MQNSPTWTKAREIFIGATVTSVDLNYNETGVNRFTLAKGKKLYLVTIDGDNGVTGCLEVTDAAHPGERAI